MDKHLEGRPLCLSTMCRLQARRQIFSDNRSKTNGKESRTSMQDWRQLWIRQQVWARAQTSAIAGLESKQEESCNPVQVWARAQIVVDARSKTKWRASPKTMQVQQQRWHYRHY